ncbi:MAG: hypothetical protein ACLQF0_06870 [Dissulfurispiraceae bacterium]
MANNENKNSSAGDDDYKALKRKSPCDAGGPLRCIPSTFVSSKDSEQMQVRCARNGQPCIIMPVYNSAELPPIS